MVSTALRCLAAIFLHVLILSGPSAAERPTLEAVRDNNTPDIPLDPVHLSDSRTETEFVDTGPGNIPVINPTTPGGTIPAVNPPSPPAPQTEPITTPTTSTGNQWCIASPTASPTALQVALDYACGYGGADCSPIQPGASCYEPNTIRDHASYAFNDYYQKHPGPQSCVFGGTAQLTSADPSNGNCHYTSSSAASVSPPIPPSPPAYTTPTTTTPTTTMPDGGPDTYGVAEPTGLPSSATFVSHSSLLIFTAAGILVPLLGRSYL